MLEKHPLPALELVRGHLALARDRIQRLATQQPHHQLRLSRRTPALRQLGYFHHRRFTARSRLPLVRSHRWTSLAPVIVVETVSKEIGSDLSAPSPSCSSTSWRCQNEQVTIRSIGASESRICGVLSERASGGD